MDPDNTQHFKPEPIFYGDLVYKFKKIVKRYIWVGYNLDIMQHLHA